MPKFEMTPIKVQEARGRALSWFLLSRIPDSKPEVADFNQSLFGGQPQWGVCEGMHRFDYKNHLRLLPKMMEVLKPHKPSIEFDIESGQWVVTLDLGQGVQIKTKSEEFDVAIIRMYLFATASNPDGIEDVPSIFVGG